MGIISTPLGYAYKTGRAYWRRHGHFLGILGTCYLGYQVGSLALPAKNVSYPFRAAYDIAEVVPQALEPGQERLGPWWRSHFDAKGNFSVISNPDRLRKLELLLDEDTLNDTKAKLPALTPQQRALGRKKLGEFPISALPTNRQPGKSDDSINGSLAGWLSSWTWTSETRSIVGIVTDELNIDYQKKKHDLELGSESRASLERELNDIPEPIRYRGNLDPKNLLLMGATYLFLRATGRQHTLEETHKPLK
jgi:hypothetical protein